MKPSPLRTNGLICFWDFQEPAGSCRVSKGRYPYGLCEMKGPIERVADGVFGRYSARLAPGQWFKASRAAVPDLNLRGPRAQVSVVAWVKREVKQLIPGQCEAIAGMWNESRAMRQYCLFLNLRIHDSADQVCGHVSGTGGPTKGHPWCMDASIGVTPVPFGEWVCAGFTYDGSLVKSYLNGGLDRRDGRNPYLYELGLFDGGHGGSDFTVGAVDRQGEMGNWFQGQLGGLAVFDRALTDHEMELLSP